MDPISALAILRDREANIIDRHQALTDLDEWIQMGGWTPAPDDPEYMAAETVRQACAVLRFVIDLV